MDSVSPERRSEIMGRIKGKNTKPEVRVRQLLHSMGFRNAFTAKTFRISLILYFQNGKQLFLSKGVSGMAMNASVVAGQKATSNFGPLNSAGTATVTRRPCGDCGLKGGGCF